MLTLEQKETIIELRNTGNSYPKIADKMDITRDQVRDFCRTNTALSMGLNPEIKYVSQMPKEHICTVCGKGYRKKESDINSIKYCSANCKELSKEKRKQENIRKKIKKCNKCGKDFLPNSNLQLYCSKECRTITKTCEHCGKEFTRLNKSTLRNQKYCSTKCQGESRAKSHEEYYKRFSDIHKGHIVPIERYTRSNNELTVLCLDCGNKTTRKAHQYVTDKKLGCKHCSSINSTGEIRIEEWLKENNVNYSTQYKFDDLVYEQPLRFDFGILDECNSIKLLIEYDGVQHFEPRKQFGGEKFLEEQKMKDRMKNEYALANDITLLRINYKQKDDIENILEKILIS